LHTRSWIGNDVVDLAEPGVAGKEHDRRFMARVFTPEERERILSAAAPTLALWKTWTAKEAAFKIASKLREGLVFAHQKFEVVPADAGEPERVAGEAIGHWASVYVDDLEIRVRWETARDYVHCIGQLARHGDADALRTRRELLNGSRPMLAGIVSEGHTLPGALSRAERASVHSTASERARLLARRLMARWEQHLQGAEIVRLWRSWGWSAPVISREGRPVPGFDVSLSHDGRFVAVAMTGPTRPSR
jgi:phosphopantetheine--protein transferase-like protein